MVFLQLLPTAGIRYNILIVHDRVLATLPFLVKNVDFRSKATRRRPCKKALETIMNGHGEHKRPMPPRLAGGGGTTGKLTDGQRRPFRRGVPGDDDVTGIHAPECGLLRRKHAYKTELFNADKRGIGTANEVILHRQWIKNETIQQQKLLCRHHCGQRARAKSSAAANARIGHAD